MKSIGHTPERHTVADGASPGTRKARRDVLASGASCFCTGASLRASPGQATRRSATARTRTCNSRRAFRCVTHSRSAGSDTDVQGLRVSKLLSRSPSWPVYTANKVASCPVLPVQLTASPRQRRRQSGAIWALPGSHRQHREQDGECRTAARFALTCHFAVVQYRYPTTVLGMLRSFSICQHRPTTDDAWCVRSQTSLALSAVSVGRLEGVVTNVLGSGDSVHTTLAQ